LVHIFFNGWFGTKSSNLLKLLLFMALYFILQSSVTLLDLHPLLRTAISYFLVLGIALVLYETVLISAVYSSLIYMALAVVSEFLCLKFLNIIGFKTDMLMIEGNTRAIYLALAKTIHFAVVLVAASILRKNRTALTLRQVAPLFPCLIVSIYICSVFFEAFPDNENDSSLALVIALVGLLYINGVIVINTQLIKSAIVGNEEQKLAVKHYKMQEQYYNNVIRDREEMRALWHDVTKHVAAIEAIVSAGNVQTAKLEYEAIRQSLERLDTVVDVENEVLNTIIYHNLLHAKSHNISVSLTAMVSPEISISPLDLNVILGNTFDNAIDECTMLGDEHRKITVSLVQRNSMLFYEIKNPCMEISTKKAGRNHGYGLKNVKSCVQKYGGAIENGMIDGYYCVSIKLNCR
jgi:hypothetical protein